MSDAELELCDVVLRVDVPSDECVVVDVPRLDASRLSYSDFFADFQMQNKPGIIRNVSADWSCSRNWVTGDGLNVRHFEESYADADVPVSNCGKRSFNVQEKTSTKMRDYLGYWQRYKSRKEAMDCLYLKDWHFARSYPEETAYRVPSYFASDWLNEYYDRNSHLNDDYRFVYIGPKGSWTPFHADVFTSFSWSANICGRKRWILLPPGEEEHFRDELGNLKYDILPSDADSSQPRLFDVVQEKGEAIFVPSGWHHQVWNLEDAVSVNHNWINGCNVRRVWDSLKKSLTEVKNEISDCRDMEDWSRQCQVVLSASFGLDYAQFYSLLHDVATVRIESLRQRKPLVVRGNWSMGRTHMIFDLSRAFSVLKLLVSDADFRELDAGRLPSEPNAFMNSLETFLLTEV